MSDLLTHWAIFDDSLRLSKKDKQLESLFVEVLESQQEFARLGALTRGGGRWVPEVLERTRDTWRQGAQAQAPHKLAFALGGITHYACDFKMKPLFKAYADDDWLKDYTGPPQMKKPVREISAYYDTYVFRKVYLSGHQDPFNTFLTAANTTEPGKALEDFVRALFQRALLSSHTLAPNLDDIDTWLDKLFTMMQPLYVDIGIYVSAFSNPEAEKMKRYRVTSEFYCENDPAIQVARSLQRGEDVSYAGYEHAIQDDVNRGGYGQALALSMRTLREATAYWQYKGDVPDVSQG